jgi:two-component system response regulator PilR (NtrC family)
MQAKLLRAIQERCIRPLGASQEEMVDVRVVSATHKDLGAEVAAGRFRQDLFYRLNVIDIDIPPLRERPEDLPALCHALLARIARESGTPVRQVAATTIARLASLPLLGNVRELENILHRALALSEDEVLELSETGSAWMPVSPMRVDANPALTDSAPAARPTLPDDLQGYLDERERQILVRALRETGFNRTLAAKLLGLTLRQIRYRIARLRIDAPDMQGEDADD